jgi:tetratricopeptide (TPR) repeat protein
VQENAVAGTVRSTAAETVPLADVTVILVQKDDIHDQTRREDGVYLLNVPKSIKRFDLVYKHPTHLDAQDDKVSNDQAQNKRPIVMMIPTSVAAIGKLSDEEVEQIIDDAKEAIQRGQTEGLPVLLEAGKGNLEKFQSIATELNNSAETYVNQGKYADAGLLIKRALVIREKALGPDHPKVALSLESYAALLRKTGDAAKAEELAARATAIRTKNADPRTLNVARMPNWANASIITYSGDQFGKLRVAPGGSNDFTLDVRSILPTRIEIAGAEQSGFDLSVIDESGRIVAAKSNLTNMGALELAPLRQGRYIIRLLNKGFKAINYMVRIAR